MFTGIVEEIGTVRSVELAGSGRHLRIMAGEVLDNIEVGDSIAVDGVCLTVTARNPGHVDLDAVAETVARTNLGDVEEGHTVNLERPMRERESRGSRSCGPQVF